MQDATIGWNVDWYDEVTGSWVTALDREDEAVARRKLTTLRRDDHHVRLRLTEVRETIFEPGDAL